MRCAEMVSTGTELLNGSRVNTHAQALAQRLAPLGFELQRDTTVRDDLGAIEDAVRQALARAEAVFVTGGLGPTVDDITRDAVARVLGREVVLDEATSRHLARGYEKAGRDYNELARRQALIVEGAEVLSNPVGVAPGQRLEVDGVHLFILPGPTGEFLAVLEKHVLPFLRSRGLAEGVRAERVLMLAGIGESDTATRLQEAGFAPEGVEIGYCAHVCEVELRFTADRAEAADAAAAEARRLLGGHVYAESRRTLEEVVLERLASMQATLATIELGSSGALAALLAGRAEAPGVYRGGATAVSHEVLLDEFGVSREMLAEHGAFSEAMARHLAEAARVRFDATCGLAVSATVALDDPAGGRRAGEIYVAVSTPEGAEVRRFRMPGDEGLRRMRVAKSALNLLRCSLPS